MATDSKSVLESEEWQKATQYSITDEDILPSESRPVRYPKVPRDLAERAARTMARHWQLSRKG